MVTRLSVTYKSPEIDRDLDIKISEFFNTLDFICINGDYNHLTWERKLDFEKHTKDVGKEIEDGSKRNKEAQLAA